MSSPFSISLIGAVSLAASMITAITHVIVAGLRVMGQPGLSSDHRRIIARFMMAGLITLLIVGTVAAIGNLRAGPEKPEPHRAIDPDDSRAYVLAGGTV
jgi:hypothetical protein